MSLESSRRVVADPLALRALAHPLRLKLHALVGREGSITAADAARQLGISQALASHHLRQLAKYGFVEPADAGDQRSRPWKVTATSQQFEPGMSTDAWESVEMLERYTLDRMTAEFQDWQERREPSSPWARQTGISQNIVYLSVEEMEAFNRAWDELITPLVRRRPLGSALPADAVPVDITLVASLLRPTESGG